jgi:hypothetical protein
MSSLNPLDEPSPQNGRRHKRRALLVIAIQKVVSDAMIHHPDVFPQALLDNTVTYGPIVLTIGAGDPLPRNLYMEAGECLPGKPTYALQCYTNGAVYTQTSPETSVNKG